MRRCLTPLAAVVLALVVLPLAGCGRPAGTDGDLINGWAMPGVPDFFRPVVGHCYDNSDGDDQTMAIVDFQEIPCTVQHDEEVAAVLAFTGDVSAAPFAPRRGSETYRAAWQSCDAAADRYLGGNWRDALALPQVVLPNDSEWHSGERTYVCALIGQNTQNGDSMFMHYRDGLTGARPAARTCFTFEGTALDKDGYFTTFSTSAATACGTSHDAEYVASFRADDTAVKPADNSPLYQSDWLRCVGAAASFLNRSAADVEQKTDVEPSWFWPRDDAWNSGDHSFACYVAVPSGRAVSRSLKGIGSASPT